MTKIYFDVAPMVTEDGQLTFDLYRIVVPPHGKQTDAIIGEISASNAAKLVQTMFESLHRYAEELERKAFGE